MRKLTKAKSSPATKPLKKVKAQAPPTKPTKPMKKIAVAPKVMKKLKQAPKPKFAGPAPSAELPVIPAKFKWVGKPDPRMPESLLVALDDVPDTFPKPHPKLAPGTMWRINPKNPLEDATLVTMMPDGVACGWGGCATCNNTVLRCNCKRGWIHSRSIEWIYILTTIRATDHPFFDYSGKVDSTQPAIREHGLFHYAAKATTPTVSYGVRKPVAKVTDTSPQFSAAKPAKPLRKTLSKAPKPLKKAAPVVQVDVRNISITKLNSAAASAADSLTDQFAAKIKAVGKATAPAPKRLKKRSK